MQQEIINSLDKYSSSVAYFYVENEQVSYSQTYHNLYQEIQQLKHLLKTIPNGALVAVQLGKMPCLLPVIISLLEKQIAFILLEKHESIDDFIKESLKPYASIKCKSHGIQNDDLQSKNCTKFDKSLMHTTSAGCSYIYHKLNWSTVEDTEKSISYQGICFVITTSGTLGRRKVVKVPEASIFSNIKSFIELFQITSNDVIYFGTPLSFDPSLIELFLALTTGACLMATSAEIRNNPQKLLKTLFVDEMNGKHVTFMQMCPSVFLQFSEVEIDFILHKSSLRILGLGGEQFPVHILPERRLQTCRIYNFYGITEVSCWASVQRVEHGQKVSLGVPLDETVFQVEKSDGTFVCDIYGCEEIEGILHIGSKTRICFIDDEAIDRYREQDNIIFRSTGDLVKVKNGSIYYMGRENDVVKRFGHRISLLNVQELIYSSTQIVNQCVFQQEKLICFLQLPKDTQEIKIKTIDKVQVKLLKSLAPELMPNCFDILAEFPVKAHNGKLDTNALLEKANQLINVQMMHARTKKELLEYLWCKYLGIANDDVSSCNFWDSGGTSIAALQLSQEYKNFTNETLNRTVLDLKLQEALGFLSETDQNNVVGGNSESSPLFRLIWKSNMKACIDSSPILCTIRGQSYVAVGNFAHTFSVFSAESGLLIASTDLRNVIESEALVIDNDFYVPCFDGRLHCLRLHLFESTGRLECNWTFETSDRLKNTPILVGGMIVFGSYDGHIYAVTNDGLLMWKSFLAEPITAKIKHSQDKLFAATLKGSISCLSSATGAILWRYKAQWPIFNGPEVSLEEECVLFVDIQGNIYCFSLVTHVLIWTFEAKSTSMRTFGAMLLLKSRIFLGTQEGNVNILHFTESTCILDESTSLSAPVSSITTKPLKITINKQTYLIVVTSAGRIHLFLITENSLVLKGVYSLPNECFSSPQLCNVHANRFYVGCRDNNVHCLDINVDAAIL